MILRFDTYQAYLDYAASPVEHEYQRRSQDAGRSGSFFLTNSFEDAMAIARKGWPDGTAKARSFSSHLMKQLGGRLPIKTVHFSDEGDWPDIGRYLDGESDVWAFVGDSQESHETPTNARIVTIMACNSTSSHIGTNTILMRGAATVALVDCLEAMGIRCEIVMFNSQAPTGRWGELLEHYVTIKQANEPLQLDQISFALAHGDSQRRITFSAQEHAPVDMVRASFSGGHGYGYIVDASEKGDIYMPPIWSKADWTESAALAWVTFQLERQGIKLEAQQ